MAAKAEESEPEVLLEPGYTPGWSRKLAREKYWSQHSREDYECVDCGRGSARVYRFDVHHVNEDLYDNRMDNLVGLCRRCHVWRHNNSTINGLDVIEWREEFPASQNSIDSDIQFNPDWRPHSGGRS